MKIDYIASSSIFVAESSYAEKDAVKAAGFFWHPGPDRCTWKSCKACEAGLVKRWWTNDPAKASRLADYATPAAKEALAGTLATLEASHAADSDTDLEAPAGLEYLPFQKAGIAYAMSRKNTLIADEMGLGKTIQAIGVLNQSHAKTALIIVPASLRLNWARELDKWAVDTRTVVVVDKPSTDVSTADVVIINYDRIKGKHLEALMARQWDVMIVDECHMVKNPKAQRTKNVLGWYDHRRKVRHPGLVDQCDRKVFLTGTPILNRPIELQPIAGALAPQLFGNFFYFGKRYAGAYQDRYGWHFDGATNLEELQTKLRANIMVRRLKADVLTELPAKRRTIVTFTQNGTAKLVKAEGDHSELDDLLADAQIAKESGDNEAYLATVERLNSAVKIAFEDMSQARHALSVKKIPAVLDHCDGLLEGGLEKLVVFAHHHDVIEALADHYGDQAVTIYGPTDNVDRQKAVDAFQLDPNIKVFIGSIKAAGVGLTLTAASHVVFAELDWVPGNVTQAEDRCHRIGQHTSVNVEHLVVDGSLDAKLAAVLVWKQAIADNALDTDHGQIAVPEEQKKVYPVATQREREACSIALGTLALSCDGARKKDYVGFNGFDSKIGKRMYARSLQRPLTDGEVALCKRMLPKYHAQIEADVLAAALGKDV